MGTTTAILGASGYAGGELLRLLELHPDLEVRSAAAGRAAGRGVAEVHPHLSTSSKLVFTSVGAALEAGADVVFSCLPGEVPVDFGDSALIVDLSDEHRAQQGWTYGLTEFARPGFPARRIANPGCYPTASLLCLLPFAAEGLIAGPLVIDALSGVSGAGRKEEDRLLFGSVANNVGAYGGVDHRHVSEIERGLSAFSGADMRVSFTPHLVPMARGLLVTARAPLTGSLTDPQALEVLSARYVGEPFVHVSQTWPSTAAVLGTNNAVVSARVDPRTGFLIASAAIDNLGKGAAGQAIQNANLALGFEETLGLDLVGTWP